MLASRLVPHTAAPTPQHQHPTSHTAVLDSQRVCSKANVAPRARASVVCGSGVCGWCKSLPSLCVLRVPLLRRHKCVTVRCNTRAPVHSQTRRGAYSVGSRRSAQVGRQLRETGGSGMGGQASISFGVLKRQFASCALRFIGMRLYLRLGCLTNATGRTGGGLRSKFKSSGRLRSQQKLCVVGRTCVYTCMQIGLKDLNASSSP